MTDLKTAASVADILERESESTIKDWLRRVKLVPSLTKVPLSGPHRPSAQAVRRSDLPSSPCQECPSVQFHHCCHARKSTAWAGLHCQHAH